VNYLEETVECVGTSTDVIDNQICHVALDTLIVPPWSLVMNEEVWVQIIAFNYYGESLISDSGNNGLIKLIPDAPVNLLDDRSVTNDDRIKFTYEEGASDGGDPVIDFYIYYDQATNSGTWVLLEPGVIEY
jgi:hypothetical protein